MKQEYTDQIQTNKLIETTSFCLVSNKIMLLNEKIDFMYREQPDSESDSGWRFLSDTEDEAYLADENNAGVYTLNTIAALDQAIIPYLDYPIGSELFRDAETDGFIND